MSQIVCGIDPSLTGTAIVWGTSPTEYEYRRFPTKSSGSDVVARTRRIEHLVHDIDVLLEEIRPDAIFIEGYSFGSKYNREMLGEFGGVLRFHIVDRAPVVVEVQPSSLKKFATGSGSAKKDIVAAHCVNRWGAMFKDTDTYDAFVLYMVGLVAVGSLTPGNSVQKEVVAKVMGDQDSAVPHG